MTISQETVIAANRFGMGAKPGELEHIGSDYKDWLLTQLNGEDLVTENLNLLSSKEAYKLSLLRNSIIPTMENNSEGMSEQLEFKIADETRPIYEQFVKTRSDSIIMSKRSFRERLVQFWSNHFAVSADAAKYFALMPTLEYEAIRPNITGFFADLLIAVEQHPAMLVYLDNHLSIGPNSTLATLVAKKNDRNLGINENLAREILELHTLGVNGGYTLNDIQSLANIISGWSIGKITRLSRKNTPSGKLGEFYFHSIAHQPGRQTLLNKSYSQNNVEQGVTALRDLANHPATARFIATKLAQHFIADTPPKSAIAKLEKAYTDSNGHLLSVYEALINLDEAWQPLQQKYKTPKEYIYSIYRAANTKPSDIKQLINTLTTLGQRPFKPLSPAGWPDTATQWSGGDALLKRIVVASRIGRQIGNQLDPILLAKDLLGPTLNDHTKTEISRAESGSQGLALLFVSPEFLGR